MRARSIVPVLLLAMTSPLPARATASITNAGVTAEVGTGAVSLSNGVVVRVWAPDALRTTSVGRIGNMFEAPHDDFSLVLDGVSLPSGTLPVQSVVPEAVPGGAALTWILGAPGGLQVIRRIEAYAGIAGFKSQTKLASAVPVALSGYTLDEIAVGSASQTDIHSFRAGADWRAPGWNPPSVGSAHTGDWRSSTVSYTNGAHTAQGEWLSVAAGGRNAGIVAERRDYASSVMTYTGGASGVARADVDLSRDVVYIGPFEEQAHAENPAPGPARHRVFGPAAVALEPAFTIFAADADDEPWQFHKYLNEHRSGAYPRRVVFNSDGVDLNAISTGAKDDMNYERFLAILPAVKEMGADTFVFDDGWMARSGDWCPDSDECPEPRKASDPVKFRARFPDSTFAAVRAQLGDMDLGLWMNPMEFNPSSVAFQKNPQWACVPVGDALAAYNVVEPNSSSNEAGLGVWNPLALGLDPDTGNPVLMIDYLKGRILKAIEIYGAKYFKFDFLAWVDCGGAFPVTMYEYHDAFVEMLDAVQIAHPEVTFSIDETNDYRMFPFESTARGPAWFLNGGPSNRELLHTVWDLAPYVPGYSLGMRSLSGVQLSTPLSTIDTAMASSLLGHVTFSFPVDDRMDDAQRAQVRNWIDFYKTNRATLAGLTYPLCDDPRTGDWTALQVWDGDAKGGWLLAYRLAGVVTNRDLSLRGLDGVSDDALFHVVRWDPGAGTQTDLGNVTAQTLKLGFNVPIAQPGGYAIYRITRV